MEFRTLFNQSISERKDRWKQPPFISKKLKILSLDRGGFKCVGSLEPTLQTKVVERAMDLIRKEKPKRAYVLKGYYYYGDKGRQNFEAFAKELQNRQRFINKFFETVLPDIVLKSIFFVGDEVAVSQRGQNFTVGPVYELQPQLKSYISVIYSPTAEALTPTNEPLSKQPKKKIDVTHDPYSLLKEQFSPEKVKEIKKQLEEFVRRCRDLLDEEKFAQFIQQCSDKEREIFLPYRNQFIDIVGQSNVIVTSDGEIKLLDGTDFLSPNRRSDFEYAISGIEKNFIDHL